MFLNYNPSPTKLCEYGTVKFTRHTLIGREIPKENNKPCEQSQQEWISTFGTWNLLASDRYVFNRLIASLGYSYIPAKGREHSAVARILRSTTPFRDLGWMEIFHNHTSEAWKNQIQLAYLKYMCHINPFYPLFHQHMTPYSYSKLLKASILLSGNSLLPTTLIQRSLSNQLIKSITYVLTPSQLPINLDSLTSLLVLVVGLPNKLVIPAERWYIGTPMAQTLVISLHSRYTQIPNLLLLECLCLTSRSLATGLHNFTSQHTNTLVILITIQEILINLKQSPSTHYFC
ncbi:hypothetical protein DSO57_1027955 [Entomophthora muscae]|uniref:Uncharacterized protein n=1 Tax=Entomophthora muscae TaxID=34485 RepID=A0ACC2SR17_9FUNG|nr:hypothetical protein DSO57_1027955 [Entomophthora muscae]